MELPPEDRVANTILSLLFLPLVREEVDQLRFRVFLCRGDRPRFMNFVALRGPELAKQQSHDVMEVRFGPDLGRVASWFASVIVPKLRFWFDPAHGGDYIAHRMPLYRGGPEVVVVRDGISARGLLR